MHALHFIHHIFKYNFYLINNKKNYIKSTLLLLQFFLEMLYLTVIQSEMKLKVAVEIKKNSAIPAFCVHSMYI